MMTETWQCKVVEELVRCGCISIDLDDSHLWQSISEIASKVQCNRKECCAYGQQPFAMHRDAILRREGEYKRKDRAMPCLQTIALALDLTSDQSKQLRAKMRRHTRSQHVSEIELWLDT